MIILSPFQSLIKSRCGIQLDDHNSSEKLLDALHTRMQTIGTTQADVYLVKLMQDQAEFRELINLLTINETYFFREPEQIQLLVDKILPRMLAHRAINQPIRILSAGCSSGEEPYTLAIALAEKYGEQARHLFQLIAVDIDSQILAKAKIGRYTDFSFRGVPDEIIKNYFRLEGYAYELRTNIRDQVSFHELNLLDMHPSQNEAPYDIVFFRNVSIYFDKVTRTAIQHNLAQSLTDHGVMIVGAAETLANDLGVFKQVEEDGLFYFMKHTAHAPQTKPSKTPTTHKAQQLQPVPTESPDLDKIKQLLADKHYDAALPLVDALLMQHPNTLDAILIKAYLLLNRKQWAAAITLCQQVLSHEQWHLDAMLMIGLCEKWQGNQEAAIEWCKKSAYAHSDSWLTHYYLADVYRQAQPALALRSYRTSLQLLLLHAEKTGLTVIPQELSVGEVRFLCEHHIQKLHQQLQGTE